MRLALLCATLAIQLSLAAAHAATDKDQNTGGTAKGAAVGALAGHEVGSGHAKSGAVVGGLVGHHDEKKAEEKSDK